jgi:hypothetical protein
MGKTCLSLLVGVSFLCAAFGAEAQPDPSAGAFFVTGEPAAPVGKRPRFKAPMPSNGPTVLPQVTNGTNAVTQLWQATMLSEDSGCTVTAVGPLALLTAAHCLKYSTIITIVVGQTERTATCELSGVYSDQYDRTPQPTLADWERASADYALCRISDGGPGLKPDKFETISNAPVLSVNDDIRIIGYGCNGTTLLSGGGGVLREGTARINRLPQGANNYIELRADGAQSNAIVCPGDSGGAAYWPTSNDERKIIGINSRTGLKSDRKTLSGTSFISSLDTVTGIDFTLAWAKKHNVQVCGVWAGPNKCRN